MREDIENIQLATNLGWEVSHNSSDLRYGPFEFPTSYVNFRKPDKILWACDYLDRNNRMFKRWLCANIINGKIDSYERTRVYSSLEDALNKEKVRETVS